MEQKHTNKDLLIQGLKTLALCVILMFAGPTLLHITFSNPDKPLYIPLLIISILICIGAILMLFKGLNTILKSVFD
ncbi:MAG: hypothetical protein BM564_07045 [Bacteroidetes bacterium MedPE-SWsnd-G2]|nr:MAG: hypothetical protein BM564_07045 [Bacteroidetes bacterium MedPE-SWsnd-G2]